MSTPYKPTPKPQIVPTIRDLPCATNSGVPQASKPAPVYVPPTAAVKPTPVVASNPYVPVSPTPKPFTPSAANPAPTVPSLTSNLSEVTLTLSEVSKVLGFTGPSRDLLAYVKQLRTTYANRMAADFDRLASAVETQEKALAKIQVSLGSINAEDQSLIDGIEMGVKAIAALIDGMKARNPFVV